MRKSGELVSLKEFFDSAVEDNLDRMALVTPHHGFTFSELSEALVGVAEDLFERADKNQAPYLPLLIDRTVESHLTLLACLVYEVPFAVVDGNSPRARVEQLWALLGQPTRAWRGPTIGEEIIPQVTTGSGTGPRRPGGYVVTTSGTTGAPKGVEISFDSHLKRIEAWRSERITDYSSLIYFTPLSFIGGLSRLSGVFLGLTVHSVDPMSMDARTLLGYINGVAPDYMSMPPQLGRILTKFTNPECITLRSVKLLRMGSEGIHYETLRGLRRYFSDETIVRHGMGSTEATGAFSHHFRLGNIPERGVVPLGSPGPLTTLVARPEIGLDVFEVFVAGPIATGYLGDLERTEARFLEINGTRMWRSGDLVQLRKDKHWVHAGRSDDIVKVRGMLASPSETTARILEVDGVRGAVTLPYEHDANILLVSFVETSPSTTNDAARIRNLMVEQLPPHLVPRDIIIYDTLPTNARGKFDRQALLDAYRAALQIGGEG